MSLTLNDLRTITTRLLTQPDGSVARFEHIASTSLADLVEVIESEGGEIMETMIAEASGLRVIVVGGPSGRYLVLRLPEEEQ